MGVLKILIIKTINNMPTNLFTNPPKTTQKTAPKNLFEGADSLNLATNQSQLLNDNIGLLGGVAKDVGNVALGAGKEVAAAPFQVAGAIGTAGTALAKLVGMGLQKIPIKGVQEASNRIVAGKNFPEITKTPQVLQPQGTAQKVGAIGADIGEMFLPTGIETSVTKAVGAIPELAKNAPLIAKITQAVINEGLKGLGSAAEYGLKTYGMTGGNAKEAGQVALTTGLLSPVANIIKAGGKVLSESVIPVNAKEAQLLQSYKANTPFWERVMTGLSGKDAGPITAGKTAFDKGIMGTESMIGVQAKKGANNLWENIIQPALKNSKSTVDMNGFWNEATQKIIAENPELSRQKSLLEALNALKEDYKGVKNITPEQLQQFKEGWATFVPEKAYKGKPIAGAFNDVKNIVSGVARNTIYNIVGPEAKQAYFDYGNLKGLQELGQKAMTGAGMKGGAGSWINTVKEMAVVPIGTVGGQTIYKVGQGIELFGKQGAKTVADLFQ